MTLRRDSSEDGRSWAVFSLFKTHRYALGRDWSGMFDGPPRTLLSCGLNPSKAAIDDDQTIRKDIGFGKRLGCQRLVKVNLYGVIETDSRKLLDIEHPAATENDECIRAEVAKLAGSPVLVLASWGSHPMATPERIAAVCALLPKPIMCLGKTLDGAPRHPARIAYATPLEVWTP
jgi:hypothetical protein